MASTTLQRVALRHAINEATMSDEVAAGRNKELISDVQSAISILQQLQHKASAARSVARHSEARLKQEMELAALRAELEARAAEPVHEARGDCGGGEGVRG